jgi:hypothetical protein
MRLKFWIIRVVLGIVLGWGAAFIVEVLHIGFVVLAFGSLDDYLNRKHGREEMWLQSLGMSTMFAGATATMAASFLAVLIAPTHYPDRLVVRSWAMAATLGALAGAGVGGFASLLHRRYLGVDWTMTLVLTCGVLAGIASAVFLRLRVNR